MQHRYPSAALSMIEGTDFDRFPAVRGRHRKLDERPSVKKVNKDKEAVLSSLECSWVTHGLVWLSTLHGYVCHTVVTDSGYMIRGVVMDTASDTVFVSIKIQV